MINLIIINVFTYTSILRSLTFVSLQINSNNSNGKSAECVGTFVATGPQSQIVLISPKSTTGCRCLDVYNCKGTYERTISINAATDKCK